MAQGEESDREKRKSEARAAAEDLSAKNRARKLFRLHLLSNGNEELKKGFENGDKDALVSGASSKIDSPENEVKALRERFPEIWDQCLQARISVIEMKQRTMERERVCIDNPSVLDEKVESLVKLIRAEGQFTLHTGAGISTSAGIPDYRGPKGLWTTSKGKPVNLPVLGEAKPTLAHTISKELVSAGYISQIITQNIDGLHWRSGVPQDQIIELHGSAYREKCMKCGASFLRTFEVNPGRYTKRMKTGRACDYLCGGALTDSIVHFGQKLNANDLHIAEITTRQSSLAIVVGSSLRVPPACKIPFLAKKVVIVSIQWTPKDSKAFLKINSTADDFFLLLQKKLGCQMGDVISDGSVHRSTTDSASNTAPSTNFNSPKTRNFAASSFMPQKRHRDL